MTAVYLLVVGQLVAVGVDAQVVEEVADVRERAGGECRREGVAVAVEAREKLEQTLLVVKARALLLLHEEAHQEVESLLRAQTTRQQLDS